MHKLATHYKDVNLLTCRVNLLTAIVENLFPSRDTDKIINLTEIPLGTKKPQRL